MIRAAKTFFYALFVFATVLILTESALRIPRIKSFISRPENFAPEEASNEGLDLSQVAEQRIASLLNQSLISTDVLSFSESTIKNEPVSPLSYSKGRNEDLGSGKIRSVKTENATGKVIYDVHYGFDALRRRLTLLQDTSKDLKPAIAIIGCSFMFGMGVNDSETVPSHIQKEVGSAYRVLNLGYIAGGANDFLEDVVGGRRLKDLNEQGGVAVYSYFSIHRERTFCIADCYREEWRRRIYLNNPAWNVNENYDITTTGTVLESRPAAENYVRQLFYNTEIGRLSQTFYSAELPKYKREYVKYLKALGKQWEKRNFKFVVYLVDTPQTPWTDNDLKILKESDINFIYFKRSPLFDQVAKAGVIPGDDHYNSAGNQFRALQIVEGLKQKGLLQ